MNLFSRIPLARAREKLKWIKQWFDYVIENKQRNKQKAHVILPTHKTFDKF